MRRWFKGGLSTSRTRSRGVLARGVPRISAGGVIDPATDLPNAIAYWDARLGVTDTAGAVDSWVDQISGISVAPLTSTEAPTVFAGTKAQELDFDGADSLFNTTPGWATTSGNIGVWAALDNDSIIGFTVLTRFTTDGAIPDVRVYLADWGYREDNVIQTIGAAVAGDQTITYNFVATNASEFYRNTVPASGSPPTDWSAKDLFDSTMFIGAQSGSGVLGIDGRLRALIFNDGAFTAEEIASLYTWATAVWI